jgi:hypothetical protein
MEMNYWTPIEEQFLINNHDKFNINELAQHINRSVVGIRKKLYKMGLDWKKFTNDEMRQYLHKYSVNEKFFENWSSDMAYVLGLWYADGYITKNGERKTCYVFSIALHNDDAKILEKILTKMNSNYKIMQHSETVKYFKISSKKIYDDIVLLGGCEKKSLKLTFPQNIPNDFVPDFIRGYFDGDGSISYHGYWDTYRTTFTCGCKEFLEEIHKRLKQINNTMLGQLSFHENDFNGIYNLTFYKHDTLKFAKIIYYDQNCLYLDRKYNNFVKAYEIINGVR